MFLGSGGRTWDVLHATVLADLLEHASKSDEADELLNEALRSGRETGEQWFEAEVLRRLARVHAVKGNQTEAERLLLEACAVAKAQRARKWELRAATALAALHLKQCRAIDARNLLEPILAGIDPANNSDLIEALALLETATAHG